MNSSPLFKIGSVDYTQNITVPSFKVNMLPQYTEWTDANYTLHRTLKRYVVKGTFTMRFNSKEEYEAFIKNYKQYTMNDIETKGSRDGSTYVTIYANNLMGTKQTYVYIDIDPKNSIPVMGTSKDEGIEVTVTER